MSVRTMVVLIVLGVTIFLSSFLPTILTDSVNAIAVQVLLLLRPLERPRRPLRVLGLPLCLQGIQVGLAALCDLPVAERPGSHHTGPLRDYDLQYGHEARGPRWLADRHYLLPPFRLSSVRAAARRAGRMKGKAGAAWICTSIWVSRSSQSCWG
jgi:hypothetical protein